MSRCWSIGSKRAVFLDRDGVLNRSLVRSGRPYAPVHLDHFTLLPNVPEAVCRLREAGFLTIVVTNQPDIATGKQSLETLAEMHRLLREWVPLDDIRICHHADVDRCECRKPKPGLLTGAAHDFGLDLSQSYMVGDRWRDIAAGLAAGCMTVFVDHGYREQRPDRPDAVVADLPEAVEWILRREEESAGLVL